MSVREQEYELGVFASALPLFRHIVSLALSAVSLTVNNALFLQPRQVYLAEIWRAWYVFASIKVDKNMVPNAVSTTYTLLMSMDFHLMSIRWAKFLCEV